MKPTVIRNFYSTDLLKLLQLQCEQLRKSSQCEYDGTIFFRKQVHNHPMFKALHGFIDSDFLFSVFGEEVKKTYVYVSMYDEGKGICPGHKDRPQCKYTIDLCINQKEPWAINVDGEDYFLNPGDALLYSGTDHWHYREKIQENNFCDLAFFHFVPINFEGELL